MTYDSSQHNRTEEKYAYDSISGEWTIEIGIKWDMAYDSQGKLSGCDIYLLNPALNDWSAYNRSINKFDSTGNYIERIEYVWDSTSSNWIYNKKIVYEYNRDGFRTLQHEYLWDSDLGAWINSQKTEYTPNEQGEDLEYTESEWNSDSAAWINKYKYEAEYDSTGNRVYLATFGWDPDSAAWRTQAKICTTWTADGRISVIYGWDYHPYNFYLDAPWISKWVYVYDTVENTSVELYCVNQHGDTTNWNCCRTEYTYDEHGREISFVTYCGSDSWINIRSETSYDSFGNKISYKAYYYLSIGIIHRKMEYEYYFDDNGYKTMEVSYEWDQRRGPPGTLIKTFYFRESFPAAIDRFQPESYIVLYPNPASDWLFISHDIVEIYIEIYDLSGRRRISSTENPINLSGLEQGVYLVRLMNQEGYPIDTRKIIKR